MDRYAAGISILFAVFFETLAVSWAYGKFPFALNTPIEKIALTFASILVSPKVKLVRISYIKAILYYTVMFELIWSFHDIYFDCKLVLLESDPLAWA